MKSCSNVEGLLAWQSHHDVLGINKTSPAHTLQIRCMPHDARYIQSNTIHPLGMYCAHTQAQGIPFTMLSHPFRSCRSQSKV
jgi:hypothetical protein